MTAPAPSQIFDPGMQPERTALAWRRTALSMAAGSLVAVRVFPASLGLWAAVPAAIAFAISVVVFVAAHQRYRRNHSVLLTERDPDTRIALAGGALIALVASATLAFGVIAAIILISKELHGTH
jgi:putative membrane protein